MAGRAELSQGRGSRVKCKSLTHFRSTFLAGFRHFSSVKSTRSCHSLFGVTIEIFADLRHRGLPLSCHACHASCCVFVKRALAKELGRYSIYKCFFEPFATSEAPSLASLSWVWGRGNPLKENRGSSRLRSEALLCLKATIDVRLSTLFLHWLSSSVR